MEAADSLSIRPRTGKAHGTHGKIGQTGEGPAGILDISPGSGGCEQRAKLPVDSLAGTGVAEYRKQRPGRRGWPRKRLVP